MAILDPTLFGLQLLRKWKKDYSFRDLLIYQKGVDETYAYSCNFDQPPVYYLFVFIASSKGTKTIEKLFKNFLWGEGKEKRIATFQVGLYTSPHRERKIGHLLYSPKEYFLLDKSIWRFHHEKDTFKKKGTNLSLRKKWKKYMDNKKIKPTKGNLLKKGAPIK